MDDDQVDDNPLAAILKDGLSYALLVAGTGAVIGGGAGWIGLLSEDGVEDIAAIEVKVFLLLILAVPLAAAFIGRLDREANPERYQTTKSALTITLTMGVVGAILACVLFFIVAVNVPAIFGGEDSVQMNYALRERVWLWPLVAVLAASLITSAAVGLWLGAGGDGDLP